MTKYFLPSDYVENVTNFTRDDEDTVYWSPKIIRKSGLYQKDVYRWARDIVVERHLHSVLDVGCGPATKLDRFVAPVAADLVGIDQQSAVEYCRQKYSRGNYIARDLGRDPQGLDRTFDLVICCDVIEHVDDPEELLAYIKQHAGPDSFILLSTPDRERMRGEACRTSPNRFHIREWAADEFTSLLKENGLSIVETRHLAPVGWFPPNVLAPVHFARQMAQGHAWRYNHAVLAKLASPA